MPQSIFVQIGQCGNQVGYRFWDLALQEYQQCKMPSADDIGHFFKLPDEQIQINSNILDCVKARAIMIDMEEGVISEILKRPLRRLFTKKQLITDVSGSGNNWAVGNKFYGPKYEHDLIEIFRKEAEDCDNLQCFILLHSVGGGTGSGLGTAALEYLYEEFFKVPRFVFAVFPSLYDDVVTSPYNAVLANSHLQKYADCVIPFQNKALSEICIRLTNLHSSMDQNSRKFPGKSTMMSGSHVKNVKDQRPFDEMNDIIAKTILNLTCSSRFPGSLNVDLNEIVLNMTPFPGLHYLVPSISPVSSLHGCSKIDQMFSDLISSHHQLFQTPFKDGIMLASLLLCRGQISVSDVQKNIDRLRRCIKFVPWNQDGWKIGLCNIPCTSSPQSLLMLANTSAISYPLYTLKQNFLKMYKKKAHLHHFLEVVNMENETFKESVSNLEHLIEEYRNIDRLKSISVKPRLKVLI